MAFFEMHYYSHTLQMQVELNVVIPDGKSEGYKTLYLLHGLSDDHSMWTRQTSIERYANARGIAVVMPAVARSWYSNTAYGARYFNFVALELPRVCRSFFKGMSDRREDNMVAGLSMGGYGALKIALTYPEAFGGCASLSGAVDIVNRNVPIDIEEWQGNFGFDFAENSSLAGTKNDIFHLTKKAVESGEPMPALYLWCGDRDFLLDANRRYNDLLCELGVDYLYEESEGDHSWKWWDLHIQSALDHLLKKLEK